MKILLGGNYYPEHTGGIERVTAGLAADYRVAGHDVTWMAAATSDYIREPHVGDAPVRAWNFTERRLGFPYPIPEPASFLSIAHLVASADVLHLHDCLYLTNQIAARSARRHRRPVLLTQHVAEIPYRSRMLRTFQHLAYQTIGASVMGAADVVTVVSPRVREAVQQGFRLEKEPVLIENGLDLELFDAQPPPTRSAMRSKLGIGRDQTLILFVGRFIDRKGIGLMRIVAAARPEERFLFVGRQGDIDPRSWSLPNVAVELDVPHTDMPKRYGAADVMVLPSVGEGFPLAAQEALACGVPVVLTPETAGSLDSPAVLTCEASAAALMHLLACAGPALRQLRGAARRLATTRWDRSTASRAYLELLGRLQREGGGFPTDMPS